MKKISKIMIIFILVTIILLGNSYRIAASEKNSSINLASSYVTPINFKVRFSGKPKVSNTNKVKASVTNDLSATINVIGMTMKENIETVTYIVQNASTDLSADLSIQATNSNTEYFLIETDIEKKTLAKGEATKVTIKIELIKEPMSESVSSTIGIQLKAVPVQPTEDNRENTEKNNPSPSTINTNKLSSNANSNKYDYNEKDDTPKTGTSKIFGR